MFPFSKNVSYNFRLDISVKYDKILQGLQGDIIAVCGGGSEGMD